MTVLTRVLATMISFVGYVALAVLGAGGIHRFLSHPPFVAAAIVLFVLSGTAVFTKGNLSSGEREDRENRWVLAVLVPLGILIGFLPAYTDRRGFWTLDGDAIRWLGVMLFATGGALRLWPVFVLGRRFSGLVAIQEGHRLVTDGVYGVVRHPSYLGLLISSLGWVLVFRSGVGIILVAAMIAPLLARIRAEDRLLRSHFGSEYEAYSSRTAKLIPGVF
ncbi:MAG: isoprenylcysteine carboxylmethyltransferase family protein [Hyphomicrobiales bacterium]|nr:isoprenylcysteine carboxylmethyltransferase family protein [Hyphomicrobiales bacterium]